MNLDKVTIRLSSWLERILDTVVLVILSSLAVLVVAGVVFRKAGASLVWYDEVASILLAWLTFYGASLAALKGAHIGFPGLVQALPAWLRRTLFVLREAVVVGFFLLLAWAGWRVMDVLQGTSLVSLPQVPAALAHSAVPLGAVLFVAAELLRATAPRGSEEDKP